MPRLRGLSPRSLNYIRRKAQDQMKDRVTVTRPAAGTFNSSTGVVTAVAGSTVYEGRARIRSSTGPQVIPLGEELITFRYLTVSIPFYADSPRRDDLVTVTDSYIDTAMVGQVLRVIDVTGGGTQAMIQMTCMATQPSSVFPAEESI